LEHVKVVANLPYYITTPIIMKLLEEQPGINSITIMIQKEVAERLTAQPGSKEYGAVTVAINYYSIAKVIVKVSAEDFIPKPEVDSNVIMLDILDKPPVYVINKELLFKIVKAAFGQRRKTLANALTNAGIEGMNKECISNLLSSLNINPNSRGETLSLKMFAELANLISSNTKSI
jgi:16S rRNA (adenine1518-N6/adenine1519-N6)-dimethyltransferase